MLKPLQSHWRIHSKCCSFLLLKLIATWPQQTRDCNPLTPSITVKLRTALFSEQLSIVCSSLNHNNSSRRWGKLHWNFFCFFCATNLSRKPTTPLLLSCCWLSRRDSCEELILPILRVSQLHMWKTLGMWYFSPFLVRLGYQQPPCVSANSRVWF